MKYQYEEIQRQEYNYNNMYCCRYMDTSSLLDIQNTWWINNTQPQSW